MKISDLLSEKSICIGAECADKYDAIEQAVTLMEKRGNIVDPKTYRADVLAREENGTTGVGEGIAIPHAKSAAVAKAGLAAMTIPAGVDYQSLDKRPVDLLFLIAAPENGENLHLEVLSRLSMMLMDPEFTGMLKQAKSPDEFLAVIDRAESKDREESEENHSPGRTEESENKDVSDAVTTADPDTYDILAVTACPTGIAHTYMAAEALEKAAKEQGVSIKVETRGSGGTKNALTEEDIDKAKGIIVAVDTVVPMERFDGKPVIACKVARGISEAGKLVERAASGQAGIYHAENIGGRQHKGGQDDSVTGGSRENGEAAHHAYVHLMSGVSHMLPFVIGGGILVALAFLVDTIMGYGQAGADFGTATALSAFLKYIGDLAMSLMVPVLAGYIAYSIADRPGLAPGFLGGLLAANGNASIAGLIVLGDGSGNTVSGFLGGIAAGFLAGYLVLGLKKITEKLPPSLDGIRPTLIYPLLGCLIVGGAMCMIFNPIIGLVNSALTDMLTAISDSGMLWLLGMILGAMMAIDMGGPINKAAYVFGTGMLATASTLLASGVQLDNPRVQACYIAMASIMVGGMVPPMGIALACWIFPDRFTETQRRTRVSNVLLAASFITEGAIPFAAADPGHVIPATMLGAGLAGLLSAVFKCTLMAPHGGVFVFATVGRPVMYILAWAAGSMATALMLGLTKRRV